MEIVNTFYAVRVIRHYKDGRPDEVFWVAKAPFSGHTLVRDFSKSLRCESKSRVRRALNYACVGNALRLTTVLDPEALLSGPRLSVRHEAESVRFVERIAYDETEIIDSRPPRSGLEQLARAGNPVSIPRLNGLEEKR